jgi:cbb3-type cytochrome oxidase subunit 3
MSSAEGSNQRKLLQRASTPLFLFLALLLVPAATSVSVLLGIIVCVIAGVENSDLQARIGLAALLIGFVGSIYLLVRARRSPVSRPRKAEMAASAPPPLPIAQEAQNEKSRSQKPAEVGGYEAPEEPDRKDVDGDANQSPIESNRISA